MAKKVAKKAKAKVRAKAPKKVAPIPAGFHTLTPYLVVRDAPKAIEFYKQALGAKVRGIHYSPDGKVMNADLKIGDSILLFNDEFPGPGCRSPQTLGGSSVTIHIYVKDVDKLFDQAVAAGKRTAVVAQLGEQTDGFVDRCGAVIGESAWYHGHPPWRSPPGQGHHQGPSEIARNTFYDSNSGELCIAAARTGAQFVGACTKGGKAARTTVGLHELRQCY